MFDERTVVVDNGACKCRMGIAGEAGPRAVFQNAVAKTRGDNRPMVGIDIDKSKYINQLIFRRPFDRGYLVNWDLECQIWQKMMDAFMRDARPEDCHLLMSEPLCNLEAIQRTTHEVVFEQFGFQSFHAAPAAEFAMHQWADERPDDTVAQSLSGVVLDAGYSFTHAVPIFDGRVQLHAVKRIPLGGKLLTNLMKEWVSYRSINLKDEPYIVELAKDAVAYVAQTAREEMNRAMPLRTSQISVEYVLPDGVNNIRGFVRDPRDPRTIAEKQAAAQNPEARPPAVLSINAERFLVPEALFHPPDIGLVHAGVCETVANAVLSAHPVFRPLLTRNVLLMGGSTACPGFKQRVERDLRPLVDGFQDLHVNQFTDPALAAWHGGSLCATKGVYQAVAVTKAAYEEHGMHRMATLSSYDLSG